MRLFLILVAVPIIEIALFIEIGGWIGTWPTIAIVILTALAGSVLLRRQGLAALGNLQNRLAAGENPGRLLADGAMILVAGVLLLTPGFFTDAVGFALLIPAVRAWLWSVAERRIDFVTVRPGTRAGPRQPGGDTIDGVYRDVTEDGARQPDEDDRDDRDAPPPPRRP